MTVRSILVAPRGGTVFSLDGHLGFVIDISSPYDTTNAIKVDSNGNMFEGDELNGGGLSYSQIDPDTDWLRPIVDPTNYYVRYSNVVGTFTSTPGAVNTPIAITVDRVWTVNRTTVGISTVTFDLEILDTDMSTVLAGPSAYRVRAENTT